MSSDRLSVALSNAASRAPVLASEAHRTRFTSSSAREANLMRHAVRKPHTVTIRVESDVADLIKSLPASTRVATVSQALRDYMNRLTSNISKP